MSANYRRPTTAAQRAKAEAARGEKLQALHDRLAEQVTALQSGEDWQRWLRTAARFHDYSFQNTLLILAQRPDASAVAGYEAWKALGRQVGKGEKGIAIFAPIVRRRSEPDAASASPESAATTPPGADQPSRPRVVGYRVAYVWDVSQTTGDPLPERPLPQLLQGQAPDGLWGALAALVDEAGYRLERGPCGPANGVTIPAERLVRVRQDLDDAQAAKTLAHELAHVRLHSAGPAAGMLCRGAIEVEAESVAFLVTSVHGLDSGHYTFPYVATWAGHVAGKTADDVLRATGQRVMGAARWMLDRTQSPLQTPSHPDTTMQTLADRVTMAATATGTLRQRSEAHAKRPLPPDRAAVPAPSRSSRPPRDDIDRAELLDLHRLATGFYRDQVTESWVPEYLDGRALAVALEEPWQAGHAPATWTALIDHLREQGAEDDALLASGLAARARTGNLIDRFRDRLMFPVRDPNSDIVGFIGRARPHADPARTPKYLNSPETALFHKAQLLYGLAENTEPLRRGARPVLVEGTLDAIAVTTGTGGRCIGVAPSGTAITEHQVALLTGVVDLVERGIVIATDADPAGRSAARAALSLFATRGVYPTAAALSPRADPADLLLHGGQAALTAALLDRVTPLADLAVDDHVDRWADQLQWVEGRVGALRDVAPLVASLPVAEISRQARRLSDRLGLELATVQREIVSHIGTPRSQLRWKALPASPPARAPSAPGANTLFSRTSRRSR